MPSVFDPILSSIRSLPKDPIKEFSLSGPSRTNLIYEENTVGVAPMLAMIYIRIVGIFYDLSENGKLFNMDYSASNSVMGSLHDIFHIYFDRLFETFKIFIDEYAFEDSTLLILVTAFVTLLIILSSRIYLRQI